MSSRSGWNCRGVLPGRLLSPRCPGLERRAAELHGAVRDPLDAAQLVGRLERGAIGDPGSGRHLRDVGGQHLQPVHRKAQRGVPAIEEPHPLAVEVPVVSGVIDLPEEAVDDVFAAVLQLRVTAVGGAARVGELLPVAGLQRGAFPVAVVPGDHRVGGRQLESHRVVVVQVGADQLVLGRDAPARREPCVRLAARRTSYRCGHRPPASGAAVSAAGSRASRQTAPSSVSCMTPVNDDITSLEVTGEPDGQARCGLEPRPRQPADPGDQHAQVCPLVLDEHVRVLLLDDRDDRPRERRGVQNRAHPGAGVTGCAHSSSSTPTKICSPSSRTG